MGTKARLVIAAVVAAVLGVAVASTATGQVPGYTTSTSTSMSTSTTLPNHGRLKIRVALRFLRNQPNDGTIEVKARCRVAASVGAAIVTGPEACDVSGGGTLIVKFKPKKHHGKNSRRRTQTFQLSGDHVNIQPHQTKTLRFKYSSKARKVSKIALARAQRSADAHLSFTFADQNGNSKSTKRKVHLRSGGQAAPNHHH